MAKKIDNSGDIYLLSLDTFMILSVVGLSLGMVFFLLNPNFKSQSYIPDSNFIKLSYTFSSDEFLKISKGPLAEFKTEVANEWELEYEDKTFVMNASSSDGFSYIECVLQDDNYKYLDIDIMLKFIKNVESLDFFSGKNYKRLK